MLKTIAEYKKISISIGVIIAGILATIALLAQSDYVSVKSNLEVTIDTDGVTTTEELK